MYFQKPITNIDDVFSTIYIINNYILYPPIIHSLFFANSEDNTVFNNKINNTKKASKFITYAVHTM